ncbi:hypothetical protein AB0J83_29235 [Actinoplanes sp. NPDC049596]|uniref:NACHT domain-containing protein n=1 Tax=unclassified Actinoplanes TaxID=2626549 RepID=UPI003433420A
MLSWWGRHVWWFAGGGLALTVLGALALVVTRSGSTLEVGDQVASMVGGTTALLGLPVSLASLVIAVRQERARPGPSPAELTDQLARAVERQWSREGAARGLFRPDPLEVRWRSTDRPVGPAPGEVVPSPAGRVTRLKFNGDVRGAAAAFRRLPRRQLVVIGAPGAGKTSLAVLLVRDLARDRPSGEPVPVLLPLAGWLPRHDFGEWLVQGLRAEYPFLGDLAGELVAGGQILPVLDGLDEIPAELRARAVEELTAAIGDRPVVVTCRAEEYAEVIAVVGTPLASAAVIELEPVAVPHIIRYLPAGQIDGERRWDPVVQRLRSEPDGPLATTLSTPLMVFLARTAYTAPPADPRELLRFPSSEELVTHLLAGFLPAVYGDGSRAERWLGHLARMLKARGTTDIAWWLLDRPKPPERSRSLMATVLDPPPRPTRLAFQPPAFFLPIVMSTVLTPIVLPVVRLLSGEPVGSLKEVVAQGTVVGFFLGLTYASLLGFRAPVSDDEITDPPASLRADRLVTLWAVTGPGAVAATLSGLVFGVTDGAAAGARAAVTFGLITAGVTTFLHLWFSSYSRWPAYLRYCLRHSLRRRLPVRLMTFLEDAYRRGVLRKVGAVYQFRHLTLQEYLAERPRVR